MYLFFDTETTGLPNDRYAPLTDFDNWPRMIQIAWMRYDQSEHLIEEKTAVIKPEGFVIPERAVRVHGITTERALAEGHNLQDVLLDLAAALDASKICVAHNMSFDEKIIGVEFLRKKIPNTLFETEKICTMMASIEYCQLPGPYGTKWPTLSELYRCLFLLGIKRNPLMPPMMCAPALNAFS